MITRTPIVTLNDLSNGIRLDVNRCISDIGRENDRIEVIGTDTDADEVYVVKYFPIDREDDAVAYAERHISED